MCKMQSYLTVICFKSTNLQLSQRGMIFLCGASSDFWSGIITGNLKEELLVNTRLLWNSDFSTSSLPLTLPCSSHSWPGTDTRPSPSGSSSWSLRSEKFWWPTITPTTITFSSPHVIVPLRNSTTSTTGTKKGSTETIRLGTRKLLVKIRGSIIFINFGAR